MHVTNTGPITVTMLLGRRPIAFLGAATLASGFTTASAAEPRNSSAAKTVQNPDLQNGGKLKLVQVVFRHGARAPLTSRSQLWQGYEWDVCDVPFPLVPLQVVTQSGAAPGMNKHNQEQMSKVLVGGCHAGQLTRAGYMQALEFGRWLRSRYITQLGFLPAEGPAPGQLAARTTNFQRTINTLGGVITGLMPEGAPASAAPLTVTTSTDVDEILYADSRSCPHLALFMGLSQQLSKSGVAGDHEVKYAKEALTRILGLKEDFFKTRWAFTDVHDVFAALIAAGKPLPEGVTPRLVQAVNRIATKEFTPFFAPSLNDAHGHTVIRLSMGVLLRTIVDHMRDAAVTSAKGPGSQPRVYLFSGHDSSLMPILSALGVELSTWPPFLSNIIFELWELPDGTHTVRLLYNREEIEIPHCPEGATLERFASEVLGPFLLSQAEATEACRVAVQHEGAMPQPSKQHIGMGGSDDKGE